MRIMALALPAGSLMALGTLWLWEKGFIFEWAAGASLVVLAAYGLVQSFLKEATANRRQLRDLLIRSDPLWTEREATAWDVVRTIAYDVDPGRLNGRNAFLALATRTIDAVGKSMFPGDDEPLARFTVPELLVLVRRVSDALDPVVRETIPFGGTLTVGQAMAIYQWRSVIGVTEATNDVWNLIRKPASDAAQVAQAESLRRLHDGERNELGRRMASAYVREVGRAAIDLYSGRLRPLSEAAASADSQAIEGGQAGSQATAKPLRILLAGQVAAGKSSLVGALLREIRVKVDVLASSKSVRAYEIKHEGAAEALLVDSPGIEADEVAIESLKTQAQHCDLLIWVTSAVGPERGRDRRVLDALRAAARAERRHPPVIAVHTHIDQLQPILEWSPPYNLDRAVSPKAQAIAKALLVVASDLRVPIHSVVPVCLDQMRGVYNVDVLWARILDALSEGQRVRLGRALAVEGDEGYWKRMWSHAGVTGRVVTRIQPAENAGPVSNRKLARQA
jgi:predicted GTPase